MRTVNKLVVYAVALMAVAALGYGAYRVMQDDGDAGEDSGGGGALPADSYIYDMTFTDSTGSVRTLSAYGGRWLVVDLTGTTCVYCPAQYDELDALRSTVPSSKVAILSVEVWGASVQQMEDVAEEEGIRWDWGVDGEGSFASEWGTTVPRIAVIDPEGRVAHVFSPGLASAEDIRAKIAI